MPSPPPHHRRHGVSGIIAALILFVMLFTVGTGYFLWINTNNGTYSAAQAGRVQAAQQQQLENLMITPAYCSTGPCQGHLTFTVVNAGGTATTLLSDFVNAGSSACGAIQIFPPNGEVLNPGTTSESIDSGCPYTQGTTATIKVLTQRGDVFSATYYPVSVNTVLSPNPASAGQRVVDTAIVSGGTDPTGTVSFYYSTTHACPNTNAAQVGTPVQLAGDSAVSSSVVFTAAGTYYWYAVYNGDTNNGAVTGSCETLTVGLGSPSVATQLSASSAGVGGSVSDTATVSGGVNPTGSVTFFFSNVNTCPTAGATQVGGVVPLAGGSAASISQTFATAGTYYWYAVYSGDANNNPESSPCEPLTVVALAAPSLTTLLTYTTISVNGWDVDTATLSGGNNPTGTITFYYSQQDTCPNGGASQVGSAVQVNGNGAYKSGLQIFSTVGTYYWYATYSGDSNNLAVTSSCEQLTVQSSVGTQNPFAVSLNGFRFYYTAVCDGNLQTGSQDGNPCATPGYDDAALLGDGYPVGGYYAYVVPTETEEFDVVYQFKVTNVDPLGRAITLNAQSFGFLCALPANNNACSSQFESNKYFIVGDLQDSPPYTGGVTVEGFSTQWPNGFTIPIGGSALINFTTPTPGSNIMQADTPDDSSTPYLLFPFLEGSYSDGTPFTLTLASTSVFGSNGEFTACSPSNCSGAPGSAIGLTMTGFTSSNPTAYWVNPSGTTQPLTCATGHTCSATSEWFTIPSSATTGGYYMVFVTDGTNYAYATVHVIAKANPTITTSLSASAFGLDPNSASHGSVHGGTGSTSVTLTISTTNPNDVVYACLYSESTGLTYSISDTSSLTWVTRGTASSSGGGEMQCWYAISSGTLAGDVITFNAPGNFGSGLNAEVFSVSGANIASPFDPNLSSAASGSGSTGTSSSVTLTTTHANDLLVSIVGLNGGPFSVNQGSGFTLLDSSLHGSASTADEYEQVTTIQTNLGVGFSWSGNSGWVSIADAFEASSSGSSIMVGGSTSDTATFLGAQNPTGSVTFTVYSDSACSVQVFTSTNPISGTSAVSSTFTPTSPGTYYWQASYPGDANNNAYTTTCGASGEVLTVGKASLTIATTVSSGGTVSIGNSATDTATLSGAYNPTGSVTFTVFSNSVCSTQVYTSTNAITGTTATSGSFTPTSGGTYYWEASYPGDANNNGYTTTCGAGGETLTVTKASVTISTSLSATSINAGGSVSDSATLTGETSTAGGTVTYNLYSGSSSCSGSAVVISTVTVTNGVVPSSGSHTFSTGGPYSWQAVYSGDASNSGATSSCEPLVVKASPSVATTLSSTSAKAGASVTDIATLNGATSTAGGTVQYEYFTSSTCGGSATNVGSAVTVTNGVVPSSQLQAFNVVGSYGWEAVYSGDTYNIGATSSCEPLSITKATPSISTSLSSTTISPGSSVFDSATLSTDSGSNAGGTVTYSYYSGSTCSGSATIVSTVTVSGGTVPNSASQTFNTVGSYSWNAVYSGDSNNSPATSSCEPLTVAKHVTLVQDVAGSAATTSSFRCTFGSQPAVNDLIVVSFVVTPSTDTLVSVNDAHAHGLSPVTSRTETSSTTTLAAYMYDEIVSSSGTSPITVTLSSAPTAAVVTCTEWSGVLSATAVASNTGVGTSTTGTINIASASISPVTNDLVYAYTGYSNCGSTSTPTTGSPFTAGAASISSGSPTLGSCGSGNNYRLNDGDQYDTSWGSGSTTAPFSVSQSSPTTGSSGWVELLVDLDPAPTSAAAPSALVQHSAFPTPLMFPLFLLSMVLAPSIRMNPSKQGGRRSN